MSTLPLVTVGLPVRNGERFLDEALASILTQDLDDLELVVADNGSTDATPTIARDAARRDDRVRLLPSPRDRGAAWNYNRVVAAARGRFFKWASHDDLLRPGNLSACVAELQRWGSEVVLAYPRTELVDGDGRVLELYDDRCDVRQPRPSERLRHLLRELRLCNAVFGVMRLEVLRTTRGIGAFHSSDVVLLAELALRGRVHEVPAPLFARRRLDEPGARHRMTDAEKVAWFRPDAQVGRRPMVRSRLVAEHVRSILAAPLAAEERARCLGVLAAEWGPRYWRTMGGEVKGLLREVARLHPQGG